MARRKLKNGVDTKDVRLDRLVQFDERSRAFPIRATVTQASPRSYTWRVNNWLDQGNEGACVGFGWGHELSARPVVVPNITDQFAKERIYWAAQALDEWDGGSYPGASPVYEGTSVLAGAKAIQNLGYMTEYRWAFGLADLRMALGYKGPVVLGLNWYEGMMDTDKEGRISPTGEMVGGHCILAYSNSEKSKRIRLWNSWGHSWGQDGSCWISFDDLDKLLHEDGEACVPVRRSVTSGA